MAFNHPNLAGCERRYGNALADIGNFRAPCIGLSRGTVRIDFLQDVYRKSIDQPRPCFEHIAPLVIEDVNVLTIIQIKAFGL